MISGVKEAGHFEAPLNVDCLTLPSLHKEDNGLYRSRHLGISLSELIDLRGSLIKTAVRKFAPDIFIADNVPRGACGELDETLKYLYTRGKCRLVLGLREIIDEPAAVQREWLCREYDYTINTYYDKIWVYGDASVYDTAREYNLSSDITNKILYTGYLGQRPCRQSVKRADSNNFFSSHELMEGSFVLCMVGGGQDGAHIAKSFIMTKLPEKTKGIVIAGPYMKAEDQESIFSLAADNLNMRVIGFNPEPVNLIKQAGCIIAMGGYNTVCEIMSSGKRAVIVPRVKPRNEQLIRAQRLTGLGLIDMIHPDRLTPYALAGWVKRNVNRPDRESFNQIDMNGLLLLPGLVEDLIRDKRHTITENCGLS
jgi:predicted glycosyltransferase